MGDAYYNRGRALLPVGEDGAACDDWTRAQSMGVGDRPAATSAGFAVNKKGSSQWTSLQQHQAFRSLGNAEFAAVHQLPVLALFSSGTCLQKDGEHPAQ